MHTDADDVFSEIGAHLLKQAFGARKPSRPESVEYGRNWLESNRQAICFAITNPQLQGLLKGSGSAQEEQIRTIADIIASYAFGIPPLLLAKAILVLGEAWFCDSLRTGGLATAQ
jgi:hypothetical protein